MAETDKPIDIFDRQKRRNIGCRAFHRAAGNDFLNSEIAEDIIERLDLVTHNFKRCLIIGSPAETLFDYLSDNGILATTTSTLLSELSDRNHVASEEDQLPFKNHSFDLVISTNGLDTVNDLPGALVLIRNVLVPDGLFLGAFPGGQSLSVLKYCLMAAERDKVSTHIHPLIDVRSAGQLMTRTGFALPVVDSQTLRVRYSSMQDLISDIRDFGGSNALASTATPISKRILKRAEQLFLDHAESDGKTTENLEIIHLCGWSPHSSQPSPARRGSGKASLKAALETKNSD